VVQPGLRDGDEQDAQSLVGEGQVSGIKSKDWSDEINEELVGADVDGGSGENEAAKIEPGSGPAPAFATEQTTPMIESAGRGKGGGNLGHAERDQKAKANAGGPDYSGRRASDGAETELEGSDAAGENADDGKGDRKIRKPAHPPQQFLGVPKAVEELGIF